jgi:hypothetical protein
MEKVGCMFVRAPSGRARKTDLTRRQLLVCAGGMSLAAFVHHAPGARAEETADAARLATLAALLSAVACAPAAGMPDGVVHAYIERYSAYQAESDPYFRAYADAALDEIGATGIGLLDPPAALAEIRSWAEDGRYAHRAAAALDLTQLSFEEDEARQVGSALTAT